MTELEYIDSGCENRHCLFTFANGDEVSGVITTFFLKEPSKYYLVRTPDMLKFKEYMDKNDYEKMKSLCIPTDLKDIIDVERMEKINFTIRANVAFQNLSFEKQRNTKELLEKVAHNTSLLNRENIVHILNKQYYVIRIDSKTRILIQKKKYGIIIYDIIFNK